MYNFRNGLILQDGSIFMDCKDNYFEMIEDYTGKKIETNVDKNFVKAELMPKNNFEWWKDPGDWDFIINQSSLPKWFKENKPFYEKQFRDAVVDKFKNHVLVDQDIKELKDGFYWLKNCNVEKISGLANVLLCDCRVVSITDCAFIKKAHQGTLIKSLSGHAIVDVLLDTSIIFETTDESSVNEVFGQSSVCSNLNNSIKKDYRTNKHKSDLLKAM